MSRYQPYPDYKDSGVVWMGKVPEHWISIKLKQMVMQKKKTTNHELDCGSISFGTVVYKDNDKIPEETRASYQEVLAGEFLVNPLNLNFDLKSLRTALSTLDVVVSTGYIVLQSKANIEKNYLRWLLYQFDVAHMKTLGAGVRQTVNYTDIGDEYFQMPMISEQQAIANFLDHETAKIDTLIEKQQRLIELLKEKRQAVISHAVTKGLDPNVKMKDSGVEWLGEVPEGWVLSRMKYVTIAIIDTEHKTTPFYENGTYLVARTANVKKAKLILDGAKYTDLDGYQEWTKRAVPEEGDILFTREAPAGEACIVPASPMLCLGQRMVLFKTNLIKILPKFILYSIYGGLSDDFIQQLSQGSTVVHFNMSDIQNIPLFELPMNEQKLIVDYLEDKTLKIDNLIAKSTKAMDLLKERRTALISAAVTGKIDVRGMD